METYTKITMQVDVRSYGGMTEKQIKGIMARVAKACNHTAKQRETVVGDPLGGKALVVGSIWE